jgi:hypothetical protein
MQLFSPLSSNPQPEKRVAGRNNIVKHDICKSVLRCSGRKKGDIREKLTFP